MALLSVHLCGCPGIDGARAQSPTAARAAAGRMADLEEVREMATRQTSPEAIERQPRSSRNGRSRPKARMHGLIGSLSLA